MPQYREGCPASGRASVVVTITPNGSPTDIPCEPATASVRAGVDGVALPSAVFNPKALPLTTIQKAHLRL